MKAEELFQEISNAGLLVENNWNIKQNDKNDSRTSHIYKCGCLDDLTKYAKERSLTENEFLYSIHRWRNFKRHDAWLLLISEIVDGVRLSSDTYNKTTDFVLVSEGQEHPFDLKVTRYPKSLSDSLPDSELAKWFYENQSRQGRFHLANRFFVVGIPENAVYDIALARQKLKIFSEKKYAFRHFVKHGDEHVSRAVILRQTYEN